MASPMGSTASLTGPVVRARARLRYSTITPMKARRVVDLVRGLPADEALTTLQFLPQAASATVYKVLASAIANAQQEAAKQGERLDAEDLVVSAAYVDEGPTLKRFRPRAQGRAYRIRKRTSHITIHVESWPAEAETRATKKAVPKGARHRRRLTGAGKPAASAATETPAAQPVAATTETVEVEAAATAGAPPTVETPVAVASAATETPAATAAETKAGGAAEAEVATTDEQTTETAPAAEAEKPAVRRPAARKSTTSARRRAAETEGHDSDAESTDEGGTR
ncbi:LSU ribosomal protein L22P [Acidothermus cellulolyticus 11B]|uniref:Large ribosomal subunit protein uL22 n=1 Tax=Acidothermus cellulolyticus (strain ATCC 43068 / DSM 8971 / 11B) TaxID=351607 RepID=RL22_ACIC1|nr:RecName: Full=Large ribosomal subunit protein uL22; AltName: Full=50S ribosomal protein L22 [Acidothermus cellulolyticus 11B]ABK52085.1 LSU ribosomal protein L22P [Acidothermus cellulolyticus 11B]